MVQVFTRLVLFMLAVMSVSTLMVHSAKAENNYTWYFVRHAEKNACEGRSRIVATR